MDPSDGSASGAASHGPGVLRPHRFDPIATDSIDCVTSPPVTLNRDARVGPGEDGVPGDVGRVRRRPMTVPLTVAVALKSGAVMIRTKSSVTSTGEGLGVGTAVGVGAVVGAGVGVAFGSPHAPATTRTTIGQGRHRCVPPVPSHARPSDAPRRLPAGVRRIMLADARFRQRSLHFGA